MYTELDFTSTLGAFNKQATQSDSVEPYTTPDLAEMCDLVEESNTNLNEIFGGNNNV